MWRKIRMALSFVVPVAATMAAGCTGILVGGGGGGAGAGTVIYNQGGLEATLESPRPAVVEASRAAIVSMGISIKGENQAGEDWVFDCQRIDGKSVAVRVRELTPSLSRVFIRVGTFGDKGYSWTLLKRIEENMGGGAPAG